MKCHYEILDVPRDVNNDDLKKAYRKAALKWHPDKNLNDPELAKEQFQLVQQAYEVLSDTHERAWYDAHRDAILKGGLGGDYKDDSLDVFPYFTTSCFKGFGDDDGGFYSVYREVFNKIAAEDSEYMEDGDSDFEIPGFGKSTSDFKETVQPFYAYWQDYSTKKSFSWLDQCDIRDLPNRRIAKLVEKENKKIRDKARKERNEQIRNLVAFVRKRDKRVLAQAELVKQQNAEKARLAEEKRKSKVRERQQQMQEYKETEWAKFSDFENELKNIEKSLQAEYGDHDSSDEDDDNGAGENGIGDEDEAEDFDSLYCPACQKLFKTLKAFANHEKSKKHKENVEILRQTMLDEEEAEDEELDEEEVEEEEVDDTNEEDVDADDLDSCSEVEKGTGNKKKSGDSEGSQDKLEENVNAETESEDNDSVQVLSKSNVKKKKKAKVSEDSSEDDSEIEEFAMLSKKQRRKLQQQRVQDDKSDSDCNAETEVTSAPNADVELDSEKQDEVPKTKLKGKKAKEARKQKRQLEESVPSSDTASSNVAKPSSRIQPKKGNSSKNIAVDPSVIDTEHTCASCASSFSSKNKLFEHLKKTGHSVYLPSKKGSSEVIDDKKKGKGRRK